jgi:hypothetical protein
MGAADRERADYLVHRDLARTAVEAALCSLADAIGNLAGSGVAAHSEPIRQTAPAIFGVSGQRARLAR